MASPELLFSGEHISNLNRVDMGCNTSPVWIGIVTGTIALCLIIVAIVIGKKWNAIKFILFTRFNVLINDDEPENVDELEFDAFILYRLLLFQFTKTKFGPDSPSFHLHVRCFLL